MYEKDQRLLGLMFLQVYMYIRNEGWDTNKEYVVYIILNK